MNLLDSLLSYFISTTVLAGMITWLARTLFTSWINKKTEIEKANRAQEYQLEIERLKSSNRIIEEKQKTIFSELHKKRLDVIETFYLKLSDAVREAANCFRIFEPAGIEPKEDRFRKLATAYNDFIQYFSRNKFYFSITASSMIQELIKEMYGGMVDFQVFILEDRREGFSREKGEA